MPVTIPRQPDAPARGEPDMKTATATAAMPRMQRVAFAAPMQAGALVPATAGGALRSSAGEATAIPGAIELVRLANGLFEATRPDGAVVQFAGASEDAGASELAYRVAWTAAAMLGKRVLFVDAWTGVGRAFTAPVIAAPDTLRQVARGQAGLEDATAPVADSGLHVAVLQDQDEDAGSSLLPGLRALMDTLRSSYDMVVLAPAPALRQPLAAAMGSVVDGSVLVVEAGRSRAGAATQANRLLGSGGRVLGVVVNRQRDPLPHWLRKWL